MSSEDRSRIEQSSLRTNQREAHSVAKLEIPDLLSLPREQLQALVRDLAANKTKLEKQNEELREINTALKKEFEAGKQGENILPGESCLPAFLENVPVPTFVINDQNRFVYANKAWEAHFNIESEKWKGRTAAELFSSDLTSTFQKSCEDVHGRNQAIQSLKIGKDDHCEQSQLLVFKFPPESPAGPSYFGGMVLATVNRKQPEQVLPKTRERFESALVGANLGWWEWNFQTGQALADARGLKILGCQEGKLFADLWREVVHPEDKPKVLDAFNQCLHGQCTMFETEHRLRADSGEWKWISVRGRIVEYDNGKVPLRMAGTYLDVTDRKLAEEALFQSEQRFRTIFEAAEDIIYVKDRSRKYVDVNPAAGRLYGVPCSELIGSKSEDWLAPGEAAHERATDERALAGESLDTEYSFTLNGAPLRFFATKVPLKDDSGQIVGILAIVRDVTDRKRNVLPVGSEKYRSKAMKSTFDSAILAAKRDITVLLTGESGSGKDYLARHIHNHSNRANGPYFSINCAAIAPELAESELFGHERGAFTGAVSRKRGLLELAEGGTLLLNEIGELSTALQAKLLTFLDNRKFSRVGGEKEISVNARLITATNRDLQKEVELGRFRKDLFYRLNVMVIRVPPLRERRDDIPMLVQEILDKLRCELQIGDMPVIEPAIMGALKKYDWPGNVRELRNVLERALILSRGKELSLRSLGFEEDGARETDDKKTTFTVSFPNDESINEITQDLKRFLVNEALRRAKGSRKGAARMLGISRYSLKHYMKSLGYDDD